MTNGRIPKKYQLEIIPDPNPPKPRRLSLKDFEIVVKRKKRVKKKRFFTL